MAQINIRMDDSLKEQAEALFDDLGLTMSSAVTVFFKQSLREGGIPFEIRSDPFYSAANQKRLLESIARLDAGMGTAHDLIEVEDE